MSRFHLVQTTSEAGVNQGVARPEQAVERRFEVLKAGSLFHDPLLDKRQGLWAGIECRDRPAPLQEGQRVISRSTTQVEGRFQSRRLGSKPFKDFQEKRPGLTDRRVGMTRPIRVAVGASFSMPDHRGLDQRAPRSAPLARVQRVFLGVLSAVEERPWNPIRP